MLAPRFRFHFLLLRSYDGINLGTLSSKSLGTNSPISRPSPGLHVVAIDARGALVQYGRIIAASFEVDVFEVEGVDMAWDHAGGGGGC